MGANTIGIITERLSEHYFCTADKPAIYALALLDLSERGISLEAALRSVGLGRNLRRQFRKEFFKEQLREGQRMRIQGIGLAPGSRYRVF